MNFGARSNDARYGRKTDEMWAKMRDGLRYLMIPRDDDLLAQLTQREYGINETTGKI